MSYTPVELRHVKVGRSLFGYNRAAVEELIEEVAQSFEATWRDRGELADKAETLEKQIAELQGREHLLTQTLVAAEQGRPDVAAKRREFQEWQIGLPDPDRFVFLDETWVKTNMTRLRGWGPTDQRLIEYVPRGHWMTTTFVGALRSTGLVAPLVVDGAINGELFVKYVREQLTRELKPGDIVVMDNLAAHKRAEVAIAIEAAGARLQYLPPYSPDLNPIEMAFAKLKAALRKAAARSIDALVNAIAVALAAFTAQECLNFFAASGYDRS